jgi:predicted Zn-dependent peptidase
MTSLMLQSAVTRQIAKALTIFCLGSLLPPFALPQKETSLPKDLPPYGPEKPLQAPSVQSVKLENGLSLWLVSKPGFPKVALTIAVHGGLAADPADKPGISELLSKTVDQGTHTRSAKQIAQEMQAAGGDLSASADKDSVQLSTVVLSSQLGPAMRVLADVLQNSSFPEAEVVLAKRNLTDSLEQREAEPSFLAERARDKILFAKHPYHVMAPTRESVAASTPADLREVFVQRFRPDQVMLIAVGDFQNEKMLEEVRGALGGWRSLSTAPVAAVPNPPTDVEHAAFVVARPGSVQTTIELAAFAPSRGDPDFEAAMVANAIYGGSFSSRLTSNIREDKGYTYDPFSYLSPFRNATELVTEADVRNEVTGPTLNEMEYELNRLATTSPTDEELSKAKHYLVGREALRIQDRASLARRLAALWVAGLQPDQIGIYSQKVTAVTAAEVNAAGRKYFLAHRTAIIAVGEENVIREALSPLGITVRTLQ